MRAASSVAVRGTFGLAAAAGGFYPAPNAFLGQSALFRGHRRSCLCEALVDTVLVFRCSQRSGEFLVGDFGHGGNLACTALRASVRLEPWVGCFLRKAVG